jgi:hypothetical protein
VFHPVIFCGGFCIRYARVVLGCFEGACVRPVELLSEEVAGECWKVQKQHGVSGYEKDAEVIDRPDQPVRDFLHPNRDCEMMCCDSTGRPERRVLYLNNFWIRFMPVKDDFC